MRDSGVARAIWAAAIALLAATGTLTAQDAAAPSFEAEARGDSVLLTVHVPEGWSLYAPVLEGASSASTQPPAGRPLRILYRGQVVAPSTWPEPVRKNTVLGAADVHEPGGYRAALRLPAPAPYQLESEIEAEIEIEWALCSDTLCIPGRSRVRY